MSKFLRRYLHASQSVLRQKACGPVPQGAKRPLVLHLEQLEDRHLMNCDPAPVEAVRLAVDVDVAVDVASMTIADSISLDDVGPPRYPWFAQHNTAPTQVDFSRIDALPAWLVEEADRRYGNQFGEKFNRPVYYQWGWNALIDVVDFDASGIALTAIASADSFSSTNIQVTGVDEADLVETDGDFLYMISGNELLIVDIRDVDQPSIASRIELDARPTGMYLDGDRLTLISEGYGSHSYSGSSIQTGFAINAIWCGSYYGGVNTTEVQVLDVTDRTAPQLVQKTEVDGQLVSSRMVDGELRLVLQQNSGWWQNLLPSLQTYHVDYDEATGTYQSRYETRNEYLARISQLLENLDVPSYRTLNADGQILNEEKLIEWDDLSKLVTSRSGSVTTIATFDTRDDAPGPTAKQNVFTQNAAQIHATQDSLYVFGRAMDSSYEDTTIWKFDFDSAEHSINLSAKGEVSGYIPDQFAVEEHDGFLRVVTANWSWRSGQTLHVLEQLGDKLEIVSMIEDIAPGENLHSVRFLGDEAFVVTFRRIDPLFAIDLSDPENPFIAGELKIPGFSDYLQPLGEDHLLGIGRGADENLGWPEELQISIFDVTDLDNPLLAHRYSFDGGTSTQSAALQEHHAVSYFADAEILAIPIYSRAQWWGWFEFDADNTATLDAGESALQVFHIDVNAGFEPLATIKHDSRIMRSLRVGEQLIVVSADQVTIHDLDDPAQQRAQLDLQIGSEQGLVGLVDYVAPATLTGYTVPRPSFRPATARPGGNADVRQAFTPRARQSFAPALRDAQLTSNSQFEARDAAAEQLSFEVEAGIENPLAIELAAFYDQ